MPVQYPISPGINPNSADEQYGQQRLQKKNLIEGLKQNLKQPSSKQYTERNTMNVTQAIPNQESFSKNTILAHQQQNANYGVTVYSRS